MLCIRPGQRSIPNNLCIDPVIPDWALGVALERCHRKIIHPRLRLAVPSLLNISPLFIYLFWPASFSSQLFSWCYFSPWRFLVSKLPAALLPESKVFAALGCEELSGKELMWNQWTPNCLPFCLFNPLVDRKRAERLRSKMYVQRIIPSRVLN